MVKRTWVLIADGSKARILDALGKGRGYREHTVSNGARHPSSGDDTPLHNMPAERTASTKALEALFASQLGSMLSSYKSKQAFDRLVLVAPEPMLGQLRKMISPAVRETLMAEIDQDLTAIPTTEISVYLEDVVTL